jgi:MFS family permease
LARLIELHTVTAAADAAFTVSLASTVLALPVGQARGQVALFLLTTMAPFVLLAPLIGPLLDRYRHGRRWAIGATLAVRAFLSWVLAGLMASGSWWLLPVALVCLVAARAYAVTAIAAIPRVLPEEISLVKANSRRSIGSLIGMGLGTAVAAATGRIGPEWSLRVAFAIYVVATILAITLPAQVDSRPTASGADPAHAVPGLDSTSRAARWSAAGAEAGSSAASAAAPPRAWRPHRLVRSRQPLVLPPPIRATLAVCSGARALAGFLTIFVAFLLGENPPEEMSSVLSLGVVAGAAVVGNGLGSLVGNRLGRRAPARVAMGMLIVAIAASLAATASYSLATLLALGLAAGAFSQLARLCLDALIQHDTEEQVHSRVFSVTETRLQVAWVVGGGIGTLLPLTPGLGFGVISTLLVATLAVTIRLGHPSGRQLDGPAAQ